MGLFLGRTTAWSQWEVGGVGGIAVYWGDLNPTILPMQVGPSANFIVRRNFDGRLCLRMGLGYAKVGGADKHSKLDFNKTRNLSFQTDVFEASVLTEFNFLDFNGRSNRENRKFTTYLSAGASVMYYTPRAQYEGTWYKLRPLGTEGQAPGEEYATIAPAILVGGGMKWKLNHAWSLNLDILHHVLFTDYLDDVSGVYADPRLIMGHRGSLGSVAVGLADRSVELEGVGEPIGEPGRQRGDSRRKDAFMMIGIGLSYSFTRIECYAH